MKPVECLNNTVEHGDCFRACVASILELDPRDVPDFVEIYHYLKDVNKTYKKFDVWLRQFGLGMIRINYCEFTQNWMNNNDAFFIGIGPCPIGKDVAHACVVQNGKLVHDPSLNKVGLKSVEEIILIFQINPKIVAAKAFVAPNSEKG